MTQARAAGEPEPARDATAATLSIERALAQEGVYIGTTSGHSMRPMLRDRRDTIVVEPADAPLNPGDVALYRRGDAYILHRVVARQGDAYLILGDNCLAYEHVPASDILGKLTGFYREDRPVNMHGAAYRTYVRLWHALTPARRLAMRARQYATRLWRRCVPGARRTGDR